ncbi:sulfatase family protein [Pleomorphovibrio marinus]|uniref:sulfatase family protein n=1 Tax=Pleomorphovibrio marinus TaxID=2164132 RepID=UPI000E0BCD96|nr:sulfatase [Pleomorphovibrio marinus]
MNKLLLIFYCLFICTSLFLLTSCEPETEKEEGSAQRSPNFVIIFADDMGYGDLSSYGHPSIKTPHLDRMVSEGQKWTNFYSAANVCTPSRAALLTGRYPIRNGMCSDKRRVLFPDSDGGLPATENTIAKLLKEQGYATAAIGKWHLGHLPQYLPTSHGFDYYFGIPYSNDMDRVNDIDRQEAFWNAKIDYFNVPLMRNEEIIERPADQRTITNRYTQEAISFMNDHAEEPFFVYLAHNLPHVPLFVSEDFTGVSDRGLYGDVIEEIDWGVGQILDYLRESGLDENTLVVFTSDNGPWVIFDDHGGSSGLFHGAKGTSYEGGVREPGVFWWPGTISPGLVTDMGATLDLLPTLVNLSGGTLPDDREYDGYDLSQSLIYGDKSPREELIYYHSTRIFGARKGNYKVHFFENNPDGYPERMRELEKEKLYQVQHDPSERFDLAEDYPEIISEIKEMVEAHKGTVEKVPSNLEKRIGE